MVRSTRFSTWRIWTTPVNVDPTHWIPASSATARDVGTSLTWPCHPHFLPLLLTRHLAPLLQIGCCHVCLLTFSRQCKVPCSYLSLVICHSFSFFHFLWFIKIFSVVTVFKWCVWVPHVLVGSMCARAVPKQGLGQNVISQGLFFWSCLPHKSDLNFGLGQPLLIK